MKKEDYKMEERKEYKKNENYSQEVLAQIMNSYKIACTYGNDVLKKDRLPEVVDAMKKYDGVYFGAVL